MRTLYRTLAYVVCALVAVQAAVAVWSIAGFEKYLMEGGVLDMSQEGPPPFPEVVGFMIHGMNGMYLIPIVALALLGVSFAAKIPGGSKRAGLVVGLVALQIVFGIFGHDIPLIGLLHGLNALALFTTALLAGSAAGAAPAMTPSPRSTAAGV